MSLLLLAALAAPQDLVAHYEFEETSGTEIVDSTGNDNTGTWVNVPLQGVAGASPATGNAVQLDPVSLHQGDVVGPVALDALRDDVTVAAWIYAENLNGVQRILGNDGSWAFGTAGSSLRFTTRTIRDYDQPAGLQVGAWMHLAAVFGADHDVTFYVDGQAIGTVPGSAPANAPLPTWKVGALRTDFEIWDGRLDDIQVYGEALDAAEVNFLFQNPGRTLRDIGAEYCSANPNSVGAGALLVADGSVDVANNDLTLHVDGLPQRSFGMFLTSVTQGSTAGPGGSQGTLCLGGALGQFNQAVQFTGTGSSVSMAVDLLAMPQSSGSSAILAGDTWCFQYWYRDRNPANTTNFSSAIEIVFQ